jgi:hypothetical protein
MTFEYYTVKYRVMRYDHNFKRWSYAGEFNFKDEAEDFANRGKASYRHQVVKITHTREVVLDTDPDE